MQPGWYAHWSPGAARQPAEFIIRLGTGQDVDGCARLVAGLGAGEEAVWRQTLMRAMRDGQHRALFVAQARGQVVGYGWVVHWEGDPADAATAPAGWYLLGLVVDAAWRRRGISEALTKARMAWAAERSSFVYYFTGHQNLASRALHMRLGFMVMPGTWIPPGGRPEDAGSQQFYRAELHADDHT